MSFVAVGVGVSAAVAIGVGVSQAQAAKSAANYNAQVANNNATINAQQRSVSLQQGDIQAHQSELKQAQILSDQRVAFGANGIDSTSGSAQNLLATTKVLGAQDVNTIQSNAAMTAWGYSVQGMNNQSSSILDKWQADNINPAAVGTIAGAQSLLGSATQYAMAKNAAGNKQ